MYLKLLRNIISRNIFNQLTNQLLVRELVSNAAVCRTAPDTQRLPNKKKVFDFPHIMESYNVISGVPPLLWLLANWQL